MKSVELSDEEISVLFQLLDIAVKSGGLNVAQAALVISEKIRNQANSPPQIISNPQTAEEDITPTIQSDSIEAPASLEKEGS